MFAQEPTEGFDLTLKLNEETMGGKDTAAGQKVLLFMCCPGFAALEIRADGIEDTLKAAGVNVVGPIEYTADPSKVYGNVEAAFMANQDAKAMISVDAFTSVMGTFVKNNNLLNISQFRVQRETLRIFSEKFGKFL